MNPVLAALKAGQTCPPGTTPISQPKAVIQKINYSHDAMIDLMIARPGISQDELAAIFDYTPSWISTVQSTGLFKARLAERRAELVDPELRESIRARLEGVLGRAVEILAIKMDRPADQVPDQLALQAARMAASALGMESAKTQVTIQQTNVHLQDLGKNLVGLLRKSRIVAEQEPVALGATVNSVPEESHV